MGAGKPQISDLGLWGGRSRCRSGDLTLFRRALYQLSYPTAVLTGFEPAASGLTGRRALQTAPQDLTATARKGGSPPARGGWASYQPAFLPAGGGFLTRPARYSLRALPDRRRIRIGSYLTSATRSFIGMMALSVILMFSGQTSVQHLVMLQ
jgi:hypothetical protein